MNKTAGRDEDEDFTFVKGFGGMREIYLDQRKRLEAICIIGG